MPAGCRRIALLWKGGEWSVLTASNAGLVRRRVGVGSLDMATQSELGFLSAPEKSGDGASTGAQQFGSFSEISAFIWSIADLMRGDFKRHEYGQVVLPFTLLRRLDCVLAPTKKAVLKKDASLKEGRFVGLSSNRLRGFGSSIVPSWIWGRSLRPGRTTRRTGEGAAGLREYAS